MKLTEKILSFKFSWLLIGCGLFFATASIFYCAAYSEVDFVRVLINFWQKFLSIVRENPYLLLPVIGVCPAFGFPISPLYVLCGLAFGNFWGLLIASVGISVNLVISYAIGRSFVRKFLIEKCLNGININLPKLQKSKNPTKLIFIVRLIPGLPFVVQNYTLSSMEGVRFKQYFWISLAIQVLWASAFVTTGQEWISGKIGLLGISIFLVLTVLTRYLYKKFSKEKPVDVI